jgi:hypothetical protein
MKTKLNFTAFIVLMFMFSCSASKSLTEKTNEVNRRIQEKDFTIGVNYANPTRGRQIYLTSEYDLRIKNDSAFAYLPYFGVAYVAPYNSTEGGIKFAEPMLEYKSTPNKKNNGWIIKFKVKSQISLYSITLDVFNNGSSSFTVMSYERDAIRFTGEMKLDTN